MGKLALVGGTRVAGTGRAPVSNAAVVIAGDRIVAAGPQSEVTVPKDAMAIDTRGKTILPDLWDMHAPLRASGVGTDLPCNGATTVRDCGNEVEFITAVRDAIGMDMALVPRLLLPGVVDGTGPAGFAFNGRQS